MATAQGDDTADLPASKPAFLKRVRIRNYKSIAFCDVTLEPLTVLVGRNASGKSNFLDALAFLADLMRMPATDAVNKRRGWQAICGKGDPTGPVEFEFEATVESWGRVWDAEYACSLAPGTFTKIDFHTDRLRMTARDHEQNGEAGGERDSEGVRLYGLRGPRRDAETRGESHTPAARLYDDRSLLSMIAMYPCLDLRERLASSRVHNFVASELKRPQRISADPALDATGVNLARAVAAIEKVRPRSLERIGQYLAAIVPGATGFKRKEYGDYETVGFTFDVGGGREAEFDASSSSDGTLRALASLVAAHQVSDTGEPPGFVAIEEPETALHPAAVAALMDALDEATLRTQVLISTHSPDILDDPNVGLKNIRAVEMVDGATVIGPVDRASFETVCDRLSTPGELLRQNYLEPDLDDRERQRLEALGGRGAGG